MFNKVKVLQFELMFLLILNFSAYTDNSKIIFDPAKIDIGYLYIYDISYNPSAFKAEPKESLTLYISDINTLEEFWLNNLTRIKMNWKYMMWEEQYGETFYPDSFVFSPQRYYNTEYTLKRDFPNLIEVFKGIRIESGDRKHPKAFQSSGRIESIPFYYIGMFPEDLIFALRFHNLRRTNFRFKASRSGYKVELQTRYERQEHLRINGNDYLCDKISIKPTGIIGMLFGKTGYIWLEAESGYNYLVKYIDNNDPWHEWRLREREKVTKDEWKKIKSEIIYNLKNSK